MSKQKAHEDAVNEGKKQTTITRGDNCPIITHDGDDSIQEMPEESNVKHRQNIQEIDPEDLVDLYIHETFMSQNGKERKIQGQVKKHLGNKLFQVMFSNDRH